MVLRWKAGGKHSGSPSAHALKRGLSCARRVRGSHRLPVADIERAKQIAARQGIGYQTVLKRAIREGRFCLQKCSERIHSG